MLCCVYVCVQTVNVVLSTDNVSSVDVNRVKIKLMRQTRLEGKGVIREEVARAQFAGVPAGESVENQELQLQIPMSE